MIVKNSKYPSIYIRDLGVRFEKGVADVSNEQAETLCKMEGFGFELDPEFTPVPERKRGVRDEPA